MFMLYALAIAAGLAAGFVGLMMPLVALSDTRLGNRARLFIASTNVG